MAEINRHGLSHEKRVLIPLVRREEADVLKGRYFVELVEEGLSTEDQGEEVQRVARRVYGTEGLKTTCSDNMATAEEMIEKTGSKVQQASHAQYYMRYRVKLIQVAEFDAATKSCHAKDVPSCWLKLVQGPEAFQKRDGDSQKVREHVMQRGIKALNQYKPKNFYVPCVGKTGYRKKKKKGKTPGKNAREAKKAEAAKGGK